MRTSASTMPADRGRDVPDALRIEAALTVQRLVMATIVQGLPESGRGQVEMQLRSLQLSSVELFRPYVDARIGADFVPLVQAEAARMLTLISLPQPPGTG